MKVTDDNGNVIESLTTEERPYMMGSGILPAEFDEKLLGLKKGQSAQFELEIGDKPAELLRVVTDEHKKLNFDVEVKAVRKRVLPKSPTSGSRRSSTSRPSPTSATTLPRASPLRSRQWLPA